MYSITKSLLKSGVVLTVIFPCLDSDTVEITYPLILYLVKAELSELRIFKELKEPGAVELIDCRRVYLLDRAINLS